MLLNQSFEAALMKKDSDRIVEKIKKFVELEIAPEKRLVKKLSYLKELPDRIYILMKDHFNNFGNLL